MILSFSVGNTNVRFARVDAQGTLEPGGTLAVRDSSVPEVLLAQASGAEAVIAASVRPDNFDPLAAALAARGMAVQVAGRDFAIPIDNRYEHPGDVGVDRLLAVVGAMQLFPGEGVVVVDFGTALTVNVGSPRGEFLGGLICLGLSSAAVALAAAAPRLPHVALEPPAGFVARETGRAINDGLLWQAVGAVERVLRGLRDEVPFALRVVLTGGDAARVAPLLERHDGVAPDLVLRGVWASFAAARGLR